MPCRLLLFCCLLAAPVPAGALVPVEELPASSALLFARRSLLALAAGPALQHLETTIGDVLLRHFQLTVDHLDRIALVQAPSGLPPRLILEGERLGERQARDFLRRTSGGEVTARALADGELLRGGELLDLQFREGQWVLHESGIEYVGPSLAAQPHWRRLALPLWEPRPDFFAYTSRDTPLAAGISRLIGEPEFTREYQALALALHGDEIRLRAAAPADADASRMIHALLRWIDRDRQLSLLLETLDGKTGENGLEVRFRLRREAVRPLLEELLQRLRELLPGGEVETGIRYRCQERRHALLRDIEQGRLDPAGLNGRSTRSCPGGGYYFFRETSLGPCIRCSRHEEE